MTTSNDKGTVTLRTSVRRAPGLQSDQEEVRAMLMVSDALRGLSPAQRRRVVLWAAERHGMQISSRVWVGP